MIAGMMFPILIGRNWGVNNGAGRRGEAVAAQGVIRTGNMKKKVPLLNSQGSLYILVSGGEDGMPARYFGSGGVPRPSSCS
jgi:hypothetical protein